MRLNKFISENSSYSRRKADELISIGKVTVNGEKALIGQQIDDNDSVAIEDHEIVNTQKTKTILILNKPVGYVCSKNGQGSKTIYDLLPDRYHNYKYIGRLDKDSSGLLLLTSSGDLVNNLSHPSNKKPKVYEVGLSKPISAKEISKIEDGIILEDGISKLKIDNLHDNNLLVTIYEGRNRQIRRTFDSIGYRVTRLHRIKFAEYEIGKLKTGEYILK